MKITHPVAGFNGYAQVGAYGMHFLAGEAHAKAKDIPDKARDAMADEGFKFSDDRPGRGDEVEQDNAERDEANTPADEQE